MKLRIFITVCFPKFFELNAQDATQSANVIISIDEKVVSGGISKIRITAGLKGGGMKTIAADYYPGKLSLSKSDYNLLNGEEINDVSLSFTFTEFCNDLRRSYDYVIDVKKGWLKSYFYLLYVYNTDKVKYNKIFEPLKGRHYTYEVDSPNGVMNRVRKLKTDDCN